MDTITEDTIVHAKTLGAGDVVRRPVPNASWTTVVSVDHDGKQFVVSDGSEEWTMRYGNGHVWMVLHAAAS
jgi:hypothetical protein